MNIKIAWINTCPPQEILTSAPHIHVTQTKLFISNQRNHGYQIWAVKTTSYQKSIDRANFSCFMHAIVAHMRLPFFKIFSNFVHLCPNFQVFCLFRPFSEKSHACPYFLEQALLEVLIYFIIQFKVMKRGPEKF